MQPLSIQLPDQFRYLDDFVADWGDLSTQSERYLKRQSLPYERLSQFYDAAAPRLDEIFNYLDQFPYGEELPAEAALLFRVISGLSEVAQAVEVYRSPRVPHAPLGHDVAISR